MGQVIFIVWRESVEALLIIGVLYAWLSATPGAARGKRWLAAGVIAGLALAGILAAGIIWQRACLASIKTFSRLPWCS